MSSFVESENYFTDKTQKTQIENTSQNTNQKKDYSVHTMEKLIEKYGLNNKQIEECQENINFKCDSLLLLRFKESLDVSKCSIPDIILHKKITIKELKVVCKEQSIKTTGKKKEIQWRLFNHFFLKNNICKIQAICRGFKIRNLLFNIQNIKDVSNCVNDEDIFTFEPLNNIPFWKIIVVKDCGLMYAFEITGLKDWIFKSIKKNKDHNILNNQTKNPYTNSNFEIKTDDLINNLKQITHFYNELGYNYEDEIEEEKPIISKKQQLINKVNEVFYKIYELDNYVCESWFFELKKIELIRFLRLLYDVWYYRLNITDETKAKICPHSLTPFKRDLRKKIRKCNFQDDFIDLQFLTIEVIENMISRGIDFENKRLGSFYILGTLTIVNKNVAEAFPYLATTFSLSL